MGVLAPVLPEEQPVKGALVVAVRCGRVPVDVMRFTAHAAVLVVNERDVNVGAPNFGVFGIKVFNSGCSSILNPCFQEAAPDCRHGAYPLAEAIPALFFYA